MRRRKSLLPLTCAALLAVSAACQDPDDLPASEQVREVLTASWPVSSLAERLAPVDVPVRCALPAGEDPITWDPPREVVAGFQRATLVVLNGAGLEGWTEHASLPSSRTVDTSAALGSRLLEQSGTVHSHGPAGEHTHGGVDPHTFLDPTLLVPMAGALRDGLARAFPEDRAGIEERASALMEDLRALNEEHLALAKALEGHRLVASHPAYDYLARTFGWDLTNLDLDPEAPLDEGTLAAVREAVGSGALALLWESAPLPATATRLQEELGIPSIVWSPAEAPDPDRDGDFLSIQQQNISRLLALVQD
ncbi:MAG: zinc ABC transporter substrate-binding protein [Planctomycetes bacterium]|nr:zinc ABC transporter substrate-binding protein [Planctomycetota bacterium]